MSFSVYRVSASSKLSLISSSSTVIGEVGGDEPNLGTQVGEDAKDDKEDGSVIKRQLIL